MTHGMESELTVVLRCPVCGERFTVHAPLRTMIEVPEVVACNNCGYRPADSTAPTKVGPRHRVVEVAARGA
jgi:C4-type Zn-finger protein